MNRRPNLTVIVVVLSIALTSLTFGAVNSTSNARQMAGVTVVPIYNYQSAPYYGQNSYFAPYPYNSPYPYNQPFPYYSPYNYPGYEPIITGGYGPQYIVAYNQEMDMALVWDSQHNRFRWAPIVPPRTGLSRPPMIIYGPGRPAPVAGYRTDLGTRTVVGEVVSVTPGSQAEIVVKSAGRKLAYVVTRDTTILRGKVGGPAGEVDLGAICPGDRVTIRLGPDGTTTSIRAQYRQVAGRVRSMYEGKVTLDTGEVLMIGPHTRVLVPGNYTGTAQDIKVGYLLAARVSPITGATYTVRVAPSKAAEVQPNTAPDAQLSLNSAGPFNTGDTLVVTYRAAAGGKATMTIPGVVNSIPMTESPAGVYTGNYTVKDGDLAVRQYIKIMFVDPSGARSTRLSGVPVTVRTVSSSMPRITTPHQGEAIGSPIVIRGFADPGTVVRVTVEYRRDVSNTLPVEGVTAVQDVQADQDGQWATDPLPAVSPLTDTEPDMPWDEGIFTGLFHIQKERPIVYTITAEALASDGTTRSSYTIDVTKPAGRMTEGSAATSVEP